MAGDLPAARASGIHMYEVGCLVETNAAAFHRQRCITQFRRLDTLKAHIDSLAKKVLTVLGHSRVLAAPTKHIVGLWRAVGGYDLVGAVAAEFRSYVVNQVEQFRVHLSRVAGSKVEEKMIDLFQCGRNVIAVSRIDNLKPFAGMSVIERQLALVILQLPLAHARQRGQNQGASNC